MKTNLLTFALISACALAACSPSGNAGTSPATMADEAPAAPMAPMAPEAAETATTNDITDVAMGSADHTTLVAALQAAGLVDTLKGEGPFTVFAPTNAAFDALPSGTVDTLLQPENKGDLTSVLTYHVVAGSLDSASLAEQIQQGNGSVTVTTIQGAELTVKADADGVTVTDAKGNVANVTAANVMSSNGVVHVVDRVLLP